jgi:hypothetical protein
MLATVLPRFAAHLATPRVVAVMLALIVYGLALGFSA